MQLHRSTSIKLLALLLLSLAMAAPLTAARATQQPPATGERHVAVAKDDADYARLRAEILAAGGKIVREMPQIHTMSVTMPATRAQARLAAPRIEGLAKDHITELSPPEGQKRTTPQTRARNRANLQNQRRAVTPDPAFGFPGLTWNFDRIRATQSLQVQPGNPAVRVGVADTGLDYTHAELKSRVVDVVDFTTTEDPPLCKTFFDVSDEELAAEFGGPVDGDFNGHGSWIGGNIAAALDGQGTNGIAPRVRLVALKISQWCGYAFDSSILGAFIYAADNGIDVVSISFGGYLDRSDPDQDLIYESYQRAVRYARQRGTVIVASAGNEHVRVGDGGRVLSHGSLTAPGTAEVADLFGLYEVPGGITGVVDVAATGNITAGTSATCTPESSNNTNATCKPASDAHKPIGVRLQNQLSYYSNYGPRIDVAAPGGARKFNLPVWDRGGTPGFPYTTADGTTAFQIFSTTSNFATQIPCFIFSGGGFPANQCYTTIQGTSMAAPHVSAVLALIASEYPFLRHRPLLLVSVLKARAQRIVGNTTPALSASDTSPGDLTGAACPTGYCHLGGPPISDRDAYGAGLVDAFASVRIFLGMAEEEVLAQEEILMAE
jgi:subtilisin family serine protease